MKWELATIEYNRINNERESLDEQVCEALKPLMAKAEKMNDEDAFIYLTELSDRIPPTFSKMFLHHRIHELNEKLI